jgi:hypothetical protein
VPALVLGGIAALGTTSGNRKTWGGFVLVLPAILWGLYAGSMLVALLSSPGTNMVYLFNLVAVSVPIAIAGYLVWRWFPEDKPNGA